MPPQKTVCLISFSDFGLGRGEYLAKTMKAMGLGILVVTNKPVYSGSFKSVRSALSKDEIDILEVPLPRLSYDGVISRLVLYILFMISSFLILLKSRRSFNFYYSRGPQPFTEITCYVLKLIKGGKIISDVTDLWPDALEYVRMNVFLKRILISFGYVINSLIWPKLDTIVTHNEVMAHILSRRSGRSVHIIYGVIDLEKFKPMPKWDVIQKLPKELQEKFNQKFIVLYAGILGPFQNPGILLELAQLTRDEDVIFVLIGTESLKGQPAKEKEKQHLKNVLLLDPVPHELMPFIYNIADLALLPPPILSASGIHKYFVATLPKKFIEYSACGRPIICITPECVASKLCKEWKAGYHIFPERLENVVHIMRELKSNDVLKKSLGDNARKMAESLFSMEKAKDQLQVIMR